MLCARVAVHLNEKILHNCYSRGVQDNPVASVRTCAMKEPIFLDIAYISGVTLLRWTVVAIPPDRYKIVWTKSTAGVLDWRCLEVTHGHDPPISCDPRVSFCLYLGAM